MGYQAQPMPDGSDSAKMKMVTPTFAKVGGGDYNIQDLIVNDSQDGFTTIQIMSEDGRWDDSLLSYWYNEFMDLPAGWYDQTGSFLQEFTLKQSTAVFASVQEGGVSFTSAGEVAGQYDKPLPMNGFIMVGNSTPIKQAINSFIVNGSADGFTTIQVMKADGRWDDEKLCYWYNEFMDIPAGWYDQTGSFLQEFDLEPGESVFVSTQGDESGLTITIPAALTK